VHRVNLIPGKSLLKKKGGKGIRGRLRLQRRRVRGKEEGGEGRIVGGGLAHPTVFVHFLYGLAEKKKKGRSSMLSDLSPGERKKGKEAARGCMRTPQHGRKKKGGGCLYQR